MLDFTEFPIPVFLTQCQRSKWHHGEPEYVYRALHSQSAGSISREEICCGAWSGTEMQDSFLQQWVYGTPETHVLNHLYKESLRPTMLISTTSDLLRVVKIACEFFQRQSAWLSVDRRG